MNYKDLIKLLSEQTEKSERETKDHLTHLAAVLTEQLSSGTGVTIPGLGTFSTKVTKEKKMYSPHHHDYIMVPPKRSVEFSPSSVLKEKLKYVERENE